jgi:fatty acid desaturase
LFILQYRLPVGLFFNGWQPWLSTMSTNAAIAAVVAVLIWFIGVWPFLLVQLPIILLAGSVGVWLFYVQHQFERTFWAMRTPGAFKKRLCMAVRTMTFRESCVGSRQTSASTMSITCAAVFPVTVCLACSASIPNFAS